VRRMRKALIAQARRAHRRVFRSLAVPNYRRFFVGHAVSVVGTWMQRVAQDWLVLDLSDSAVALGISMALQFLPMLVFGLWGGVIADRLDRRRVLMVTQSVSGALAAILAVLVFTDVVELWMVYALALGLGLATVVDVPTRHSLITEMVAPEDYVNAQALNSTVANTGRLVGPALAGLLIAVVGVGAAFALNALSFVAVLVGLARMDPGQLRRLPAPPREKAMVRQGLQYAWRHPQVRACLFVVAVVALLGQNYRVVLPLFARDTFHGDADVYGWLTSALGAGALLGALASAAREVVAARSLLVWTWVFAAVNVVAAITPRLGIALAVMVALGVAHICFNTLARTLLQLGTEASMQGRVIALHSMVFLGSTPVGSLIIGWVCEQWGARAGLLVAGVAAGLAALSARWVERQPRQAEPGNLVAPDGEIVERRAEVGQFGDVRRREVGGVVTESGPLDADAREHLEVQRAHDGLLDGVLPGAHGNDPMSAQDADR